jgi:hypothetical protein
MTFLRRANIWNSEDRSSRKRSWENQELRWVLQDSAGMKLPLPAKKTPTWKVKLIKEGVRKAIWERAERPPRTSQRDQSAPEPFRQHR